jgi:hypothetical protein
MLTFDPIMFNCLGGPEWVAYYYALVAVINIIGFVECPTPEDPLKMCPVYDGRPLDWIEFRSPGDEPSIDIPEPTLGGFVMIHLSAKHPVGVMTMDTAGNSSEDLCLEQAALPVPACLRPVDHRAALITDN